MGISEKKVFQLYHDLVGVVGVMTDEQAGKLLKAILAYVNGQPPELDDPVVLVAFQPARQQLDRDHEAYLRILERNKENGKKGGRPKKTQQNPENPVGYLGTQANPSKPKKADTDTDTDTDKDITTKKEPSKKKTKLQILYEIPIPSSLGLDFIDTWKEWLDYLNESRKLPTTTTATKQLEKLERWGPSAAKVAIDKSISSGWKGLFEPTPQELASNSQPVAEIQATLAEPVGWKEAARRYPEETQQRIGDTWENVPEELKGYLIEDCNKHLTYGEEA